MSNDDTRCCGTGTCIINSAGECWCGQRWDGEKMCFPVANVQAQDPSKINGDGMASDVSGSASNFDESQ